MSRIVCVIPARYESSRFAGKPLAELAGKPMIQHVYERVLLCPSVHAVAVATDDERIYAAVQNFGGRAVMTAASHRSGTDRIAEAVEGMGLDDQDIVVNIQGDQPLFEPAQVDEVTAPLRADGELLITTLIYAIRREEEITHPNAVKVVFDRNHFALYFSRATIPYHRDGDRPVYYKHHGIYAYRRSFLPLFSALETGQLERLESLEQLRAMEQGYPVKVVESAHDSIEVDTPEELERVRRILAGKEIAP